MSAGFDTGSSSPISAYLAWGCGWQVGSFWSGPRCSFRSRFFSLSHFFTAQSLGKSFGILEVLKGASLWGDAGSVTALLGRNGSGKTTLLECAFGLKYADYGVVKVGELAFEHPAPHRLAHLGVFYLPARDLLSPAHTIDRHLKAAALVPLPARRRTEQCAGEPLEIAERMGIAQIVRQRCFQISGGERRRAQLALALLRCPRCLLADEPCAGITPADRVAVSETLRELARQGCAVVITGHDVADVLAVADTVTWMAAGTTHQLGTPEEARRHDQFVREYLGS